MVPTEEEFKKRALEARRSSKEEQVKKVNALLSYLYSLDWLSRKFKFYIKSTKRLMCRLWKSMRMEVSIQ